MDWFKKICGFTFVICLLACNNNDHKVKPQESASALSDLKKAVAQYPDSLILVQELVQAYRNEGRYDSAINVTERQLNRDPGNAHLWNIKATLYFEKGDTLESVNALEHAIEIYPLPQYIVALGTVYAELKNKNAIHIADELLYNGSEKNYDDAYFIKGLYFNYINQPQQAIKMLDSCLAMDYTYMYAYREKAIALYNLKKYDQSINVLKRAVTLQNNFDEGYYWMGRSYEKSDKPDSAIACYQNALLYDKNYVEASEALDRLTKKK